MRLTTFAFGLSTLALGIASAASTHSLDLTHSVTIGSTELQAGSYKVEIQGDKATFKTGKTVIEVPATLGTSAKKYPTTGIVTSGPKLIEIDFGGTTEKILFSADAPQNAGGGGK
jgi:hypothetical protein